MKKNTIKLLGLASALVCLLASADQQDSVITKEKDVMVVNTTSLTRQIRGFKGTTPVKIYIEKNRILKIEALPNRETPKNGAMAQAVLDRYEDMSVKKAARLKVDAVTGATYTSRSLLRNVKVGLDYYKQHR
jgi:electron transport complex protein RnfG